MEVKLVKAEWGEKRICQSCGARFYDMLRSPIVCPTCETVYEPVISGRGSRAKNSSPAPEPAKPKEKGNKEGVDLISDEGEIPNDTDLDLLGEDDDTDDLIEDVSDLGEEEDMLGVIDNDAEKPDELNN